MKKLLAYGIVIITFVIIALAYFSPVLEGEKIYQSDIVQYTGMSKEIHDFRAEYDAEPYWTNAAFGGMPAYQVSALYPHDYIKKLDKLIRFLPRPADYLFLYFISFFVLMLVLKVDWKLAFIGALAFGFSTYLIIIIGVGHNAKAHAIGYMPLVLAGVLLVFQKKYLYGFILTTLSVALEIVAGHIQMTYYLFFMLLSLGVFYFLETIKTKEFSAFFKSTAVLLVAGLLALIINANHLLPTREYAKESTRSQTELTLTPEGKPKTTTSGLSKDYITEYSYGIFESFNLFIPRLTGGSNSEKLGTDSHLYHFLKNKIDRRQAKDFANNAPTYWGDQPFVGAPAYIGAVIIFLFVLSLFLLENKHKKWLVTSIIIALLLSWGKNLEFLTNLFIDYVPLYNKFRAVSSIQVLIELAIPILAILGLQKFFFDDSKTPEEKEKALKYATGIAGSIALFFLVFGSSWFSFHNASDMRYEESLPGFTEALIQDRKAMLFNDSFRTLVLVLLAAISLWLFNKKKIKLVPVIVILALLFLYDGVSIAKNYVNDTNFVSAIKVKKPFTPSLIDKEIMKDKGHYRVINFGENPMNDGSTSYFHNSIGGYHAAKPRRYQELYTYQIAQSNFEVLNMLHAKYMIVPEKNGLVYQENTDTYGNAWFATDLVFVNTADEELAALSELNKNKAVFNKKYQDKFQLAFKKDSTANIELTSYKPNEITYKSTSKTPQLTLFSEMYYKHGWKAYVDGIKTEIFPVNYVLRAIVLPEGNHEITFSFQPEIVKKSGLYSLIGYVLFFVLASLGWFFSRKQ